MNLQVSSHRYISLLPSRSSLCLVRSFSSLPLFLSVSLASLRPLSQANYLLVRYQIPPVLPVISCPVLPCLSALSSLFSPSCREILSNSSTRGSFSLSLSHARNSFSILRDDIFFFHRIVQLVLLRSSSFTDRIQQLRIKTLLLI